MDLNGYFYIFITPINVILEINYKNQKNSFINVYVFFKLGIFLGIYTFEWGLKTNTENPSKIYSLHL